MRHLNKEAENVVNISISTNCYSFYVTLKAAERKVIQLLKEMRIRRKRIIRKKKKMNCPEMFEKKK